MVINFYKTLQKYVRLQRPMACANVRWSATPNSQMLFHVLDNRFLYLYSTPLQIPCIRP